MPWAKLRGNPACLLSRVQLRADRRFCRSAYASATELLSQTSFFLSLHPQALYHHPDKAVKDQANRRARSVLAAGNSLSFEDTIRCSPPLVVAGSSVQAVRNLESLIMRAALSFISKHSWLENFQQTAEAWMVRAAWHWLSREALRMYACDDFGACTLQNSCTHHRAGGRTCHFQFSPACNVSLLLSRVVHLPVVELRTLILSVSLHSRKTPRP